MSVPKIPEPITVMARKTGYSVEVIKKAFANELDDFQQIHVENRFYKLYGCGVCWHVSTFSRKEIVRADILRLMDGLLEKRRYSVRDLARLTGRPYQTCRRWADPTKDPDAPLVLSKEEKAALFFRPFGALDPHFVKECRELEKNSN